MPDTVATPVAPNTWTQVTSGAGEYEFTANRVVIYSYSILQPVAGSPGHALGINEARVAVIDFGRELWMFHATQAFTAVVTKSW